jgi:S-adenosylmethionine:tRNA-ribosyltransferase-isomerase (queuine synthetase)
MTSQSFLLFTADAPSINRFIQQAVRISHKAKSFTFNIGKIFHRIYAGVCLTYYIYTNYHMPSTCGLILIATIIPEVPLLSFYINNIRRRYCTLFEDLTTSGP